MASSKEIQEYIAQIEAEILRLKTQHQFALSDLCEAYHLESGLKVGDVVEVEDGPIGVYLGFRFTQYGTVVPEVAQITKTGKPHSVNRVYISEYQPGMLEKV